MQPHARRTHPLDHAELAMLYHHHGESLYRYCLRLLSCPDDAGDALQDTFTNLAQRHTSPPADRTAQRVYLFAAARSACLDLRRRTDVDAFQDAAPSTPQRPTRSPLLRRARES